MANILREISKQDGIQKTRIEFYKKGKMGDKESTVEIKIQSQFPLCPIQTKKKDKRRYYRPHQKNKK